MLRAQFPFHTCHCQYPGTAVECIFHSLPLRWQPSPHRLAGRPVHHPFRGVLSIHSRCGLRVRQDTNVSLYTRGSSQFVTSLTAPVASGRSESDRVGFAPTGKAPPLHGARRTWGALTAGVLGTVAQHFLTRAYQMAPAIMVSSVSYITPVISLYLGFILFDKRPDSEALYGGALILVSGLLLPFISARFRFIG